MQGEASLEIPSRMPETPDLEQKKTKETKKAPVSFSSAVRQSLSTRDLHRAAGTGLSTATKLLAGDFCSSRGDAAGHTKQCMCPEQGGREGFGPLQRVAGLAGFRLFVS